MNHHPHRIAAALALGLALLGMAAHAHGPDMNEAGNEIAATAATTEGTPFGHQGDPEKVTRTIVIDMRDTMRFGPATIRVRQGETIRFVARNRGKLIHEIVLGTLDEMKAHRALMKKNPEMEHEEPYMVHVSPGKKQELVWRFTKPGEFHYACLLPGHFEAGMIGRIVVAAG